MSSSLHMCEHGRSLCMCEHGRSLGLCEHGRSLGMGVCTHLCFFPTLMEGLFSLCTRFTCDLGNMSSCPVYVHKCHVVVLRLRTSMSCRCFMFT